jgi:hypothetical protein
VEDVTADRAGDFSDPPASTVRTWLGLAVLAAGATRIEITYEDLLDGAGMRFRDRRTVCRGLSGRRRSARRREHTAALR